MNADSNSSHSLRLETRNQKPVIGYKQPAGCCDQQPITGFTLLEVMVAMAIMAIVLVSVYRMHSQTLTMNAANRFYTQAPMLGQSKLAQLESSSLGITSGDSGDFGDKFPGYRWRISMEDVSSEALGEIGSDLKKIDLTVSFNDNEYVYNIRTYRLIRQ
jgi:general secretion pathway protein I